MRRPQPDFIAPKVIPREAPIETLPAFWSPRLAGVRGPDPAFAERLAAIDRDLAVTWNARAERWQLWVKCPRVTFPLCAGWRLLFIHNGPSGEYLPLDERLFARLYAISAPHQGISNKQHFERVMAEMERDKAEAERVFKQGSFDSAGEVWDHAQIRVGYGPSSGSKFSKYHA